MGLSHRTQDIATIQQDSYVCVHTNLRVLQMVPEGMRHPPQAYVLSHFPQNFQYRTVQYSAPKCHRNWPFDRHDGMHAHVSLCGIWTKVYFRNKFPDHPFSCMLGELYRCRCGSCECRVHRLLSRRADTAWTILRPEGTWVNLWINNPYSTF